MTARSRTRRWLLYSFTGVLALVAFGGGYHTLATSPDRQRDRAPGRLVDMGGRRLHLVCAGSGSPTVLLQSGLGETAGYWAWISAAVATETQVCAYDRAGRGWSDAAARVQDGEAVAADLRALLDRVHIDGPLVLVGHSSGAQYVRIFTGRYPARVAGIVLLDGQPADAFERLPDFPAFYDRFRRVSALLPSGFYRSLRDEFATLPTSLRQAHTVRTFGDLPLVVVTALHDAQDGWLPLQDELAAMSTNSSHRVVPYSHGEVVTDREASEVSSQAIRDVVHAVRFNVPLEKSS